MARITAVTPMAFQNLSSPSSSVKFDSPAHPSTRVNSVSWRLSQTVYRNGMTPTSTSTRSMGASSTYGNALPCSQVRARPTNVGRAPRTRIASPMELSCPSGSVAAQVTAVAADLLEVALQRARASSGVALPWPTACCMRFTASNAS